VSALPEPTLGLVHEVRPAVAAAVRRTPLLPSDWLSAACGTEVVLKCECLQVTGSFKVRGAVAAMSRLTPREQKRGVVACSTGNHGIAMATAAARAGIACTIVVPGGVAPVKAARISDLGARLVTAPHAQYDDTQTWTLEHLEELGGVFVSPFEHPAVIAGNGGTTALEILEDFPAPDAVVTPVGGGGLAAGLGLVLAAESPGTRLVGGNAAASPGMWLSRRDGRAHLRVESLPTLADGIEGGVGEVTFRLGNRFLHDVVCVDEAAIAEAVALTARHEGLVIEGASAVAVAVVLSGAVAGPRICVVLTGSNIGPEKLKELL